MNIQMLDEPRRGHAHDVDLEDTFDFLNTDDTDNGFPRGEAARRSTARSRGSSTVASSTPKVPTASAPRRQPTARSRRPELARVHRVRSALRDVAHAISEHRAPDTGSLETINRALHARQIIELVPAPDGCSVDHRHVGDPIDDALARLTEPLVLELTEGHPERIKTCASDTCDWIFYDASRTSRRRWCDMATCGNRAKAARHRAKERAVQADASEDSAPPPPLA